MFGGGCALHQLLYKGAGGLKRILYIPVCIYQPASVTIIIVTLFGVLYTVTTVVTLSDDTGHNSSSVSNACTFAAQ